MSIPAPSRADVITRLRAAGCVFAEDEAHLLIETARTTAELLDMIDRRVAGLPLEHVLGRVDFRGLRLAVDPGVFVPRRRTEFLVDQAVTVVGAQHLDHRVVVVDLCCGSGAVGLALAAAIPDVELHAADIDPRAVACARRNLAPYGGRVHQGDLYDPLPARLRGRVDVLVVNAPYVPTEEIALLPREARDHEPLIALDGGRDGLDIARRVTAQAPDWLAPHGRLLIETSRDQAPLLTAAAEQAGLRAVTATATEHDATVVTATRDAPRHATGPFDRRDRQDSRPDTP